MALRFLSMLLTATLVWACAGSLLAQQTSATCTPHGRYVVGETVVCDDTAQQAHLATWWANSPIGNFCRSVVRDTKRNNCWPEPFVKADREAVREPFVRMVANGWQRQNTLGDHHFDPETGQLNRDGQLKVRRVLIEGLPQHRSFWVYRA
ncbi:MAG TPA: hypothetical protein DD670_05300, partial [Planctomycetaceae bacterium]|nr:hypothetical protein [Planctomycetaceae bacterium]